MVTFRLAPRARRRQPDLRARPIAASGPTPSRVPLIS